VNFFIRVKNLFLKKKRPYRLVFDHAAMGIVLLDEDERIVVSNPAFSNMLGYANQELVGKKFSEFIHPEETSLEKNWYYDLRAGARHESAHFSIQCLKKDGTSAWMLVALSFPRPETRNDPFAVCMIADITDRKRAEDAFLRSRNFYLPLIDELPNPIRRTDTDGNSDYFNKAWLNFTGRTMSQEIGSAWMQGVHPDDLERLKKLHVETFSNRVPYVTEYRLKNYAEEYRWIVEFGRPFQDPEGHFDGYISSCYDVQERKNFEQTLESISMTDDLTGLLNRRGFFSLAQQQLRVAHRTRKGFVLFYADLDGLKKINDTLGHPEGDLALVETASVLKEVFRESDIIGRFGGDEFAVLMLELNGNNGEGEAILARMRESIKARNVLPGRRYYLSISTGMKCYDPEHPRSLDELISGADAMMYHEKERKYQLKKYGT